MKTSARNALPGVIQNVIAGAVNAEVTLRLTGGDEIVSVVTMESVRDLGLELGVPATALIKSSFVILAPGTQRLRTSPDRLAVDRASRGPRPSRSTTSARAIGASVLLARLTA